MEKAMFKNHALTHTNQVDSSLDYCFNFKGVGQNRHFKQNILCFYLFILAKLYFIILYGNFSPGLENVPIQIWEERNELGEKLEILFM